MRRLGPQIALRTWAFRHQRHGGQSSPTSCSSHSTGGRQAHAVYGLPGECQIDVSSGVQWEDHGAWRSSADGQFLPEAPHEGDTCQRHIVGGCIFESSCGPDLANCFPSGASWKCLIVGSEIDAARIVVQVLWTSRDSHDRPVGMLQRPFISGMAGFEKREMGSATS